MAGLVVDGGAQLTATRRANHLAEQAARAGAQAADTAALHTGAVRLDADPRPDRRAGLPAGGARPGPPTAPYDVTVTVGADTVTVALHTAHHHRVPRPAGHPAPCPSPGRDRPACCAASPRSSHDHHPAARHRARDPDRGGAPRPPGPPSRAAAGTSPAPPAPHSPWLALLVGLPLALGLVGGNPLPTTLPTLGQVGAALTRPDPGNLITQTLLLVAWAAWAGFALTVVVEAQAQLRGRGAPRLPGAGRAAAARSRAGRRGRAGAAQRTPVALALPQVTTNPAAVRAAVGPPRSRASRPRPPSP